jgi:hypothetical protein
MPNARLTKSKRIDTRTALRFAFSWITDARYGKLAGAFFVSEALSAVVIPILAALLLILVVPEVTDLPGFLTSNVSDIIVVSLIVVAVLSLFIFTKRWHDEKDFVRTFLSVFPIRLAVSLVPLLAIFVLLGYLLSSVDMLSTVLSSSPTNILSGPLLVPLGAIGVVFLIAMAIATVSWMYTGSFFLISKVLEPNRIKTEFLDINIQNILSYTKFILLTAFVILFNFLSRELLYLQIVTLALSLAIIVFGPAVPLLSSLLWITIPIYVIVMIYNCIRLLPASTVRILETDGIMDALKRTWRYTDGSAFLIALVLIAAAVVTAVLTLLLSVLPVILEFFASSNLFLTPFAIAVRALTNAVGVTMALVVAAFVNVVIYSKLTNQKRLFK